MGRGQGLLAKEGGLYLAVQTPGVPEFLVIPLLIWPVCLLYQGSFGRASPPHFCGFKNSVEVG